MELTLDIEIPSSLPKKTKDYGIRLLEEHENAITLMALAKKDTFKQCREKALMALAGCKGKNPSDTIIRLIGKLLPPWKKEKLEGKLIEAALTGEMNPYEIIGAIKETYRGIKPKHGNPRLTPKAMTEAWTKLSIACALLENKEGSIIPEDFDLEKVVTNQAILPKAKALEASYKEKAIEGRYHATRPHLQTSGPGNINWAEILGNLPADSAAAALSLLKANPTNMRKKEFAENLFWPHSGPAETENRRLNTFLHSLPGLPQGRASYVANALAASNNPPHTAASPTPKPENKKQEEKREEIEKEIEEIIASPEKPKSESEFSILPMTSTGASIHTPLNRLCSLYQKTGKIHPSKQQELRTKILELIKPLDPNTSFGPGKELHAIATNKPVPDTDSKERSPEWEERNFQATVDAFPNSKKIPSYLAKGTLSAAAIDLAAEKSPAVKAYRDKSIASLIGKMVERSGTKTIIECLLAEKDLDPDQKFGENQNSLVHIAAWWRSPATLETALKAQKDPLPKNKRGTTPGFYCKTKPKVEILAAFPIDPQQTNNSGIELGHTSIELVEALNKKVTREKAAKIMAAENDLEI